MPADFSPLLQHCLAKASMNRVAAPALASVPPTKDQVRTLQQHCTAKASRGCRPAAPKHLALAAQPQVLPAPAYLEPQLARAARHR